MDTEKIYLFIERVWKLIRPKFYNRLTWAVVLTGLLLLASPWWSDIVIYFANKYLNLQIPGSDSHFDFGLKLVAFGLSYNLIIHLVDELLTHRRESASLKDQRTHDRQIFQHYVDIMPERDLGSILGDMRNQHAYVSPQGNQLDAVISFFRSPENQLLNQKAKDATQAFGKSLQELRNWTSLKFYAYGQRREDGYRYCLTPELNPDRGNPTPEQSVRYGVLSDELDSKIEDVEEKYLKFRSAIKEELII